MRSRHRSQQFPHPCPQPPGSGPLLDAEPKAAAVALKPHASINHLREFMARNSSVSATAAAAARLQQEEDGAGRKPHPHPVAQFPPPPPPLVLLPPQPPEQPSARSVTERRSPRRLSFLHSLLLRWMPP